MNRLWMVMGWVVGIVLLGCGSVQAAGAMKTEPPRLVVQAGHGWLVASVAFSPDGKTLVSGSWDNTLKLWDVSSGRELRTLSGHKDHVTSVAFSPDGKSVVSGSQDHTLKLWDVKTGQELRTFSSDVDSIITSVAFSPDGKNVVSGSFSNILQLWDVTTGSKPITIGWHDGVETVSFSPDGRTVVSGGKKTLKIWDVSKRRENGSLSAYGANAGVHTFAGHGDNVRSVAFSPDGKTVVSGSDDKTLKIWDITTGKELRTLAGHTKPVKSVAFSPDGKIVVSGSKDHTLKLWDVASGQELSTLTGSDDEGYSVAFSPDGKTVVSGGFWGNLKLWSVATGKEHHFSDRYGRAINSVAYSPNGKTLFAGGKNKTLTIWDMDTGQERHSLSGHGDMVWGIAYSPDGKSVVSGSQDNTLKLWESSTRRELSTFSGHSDLVYSVAISPDSKTIVSGSWDKTIKLWDAATGKELRTLVGHGDRVSSVAFSPDGKTVVSGNWDKTLKLWDVATGSEIRTLTGHSGSVASVAFSPDGKTLVSGSDDETLKFWEAATGKELLTLVSSAHGDTAISVAFSPDGKTIASGSLNNTAKLWEVSTGRVLTTLVGHNSWIGGIAYSPDGKTLATGSIDKTIKLWRVSDGTLLATLTSFTDGHWAVTDPEGRFDASNGGDNPHLHWVFENTPIDLAQLKDRYYDPGLLQKIMGFGTEPLRTVPKFEDALLHKWPEVAVNADDKNPLRLNIRLVNRGDGYGRVRVRLNDKEITADATAGKKLSGKTVSLSLDLDPTRLLPGDNRVDVVAWPGVGHIPSPAAKLVVSGAATRGAVRSSAGKVQAAGKPQFAEPVTLHAIIMGVSQYAGPNLRLAFPGKDAADFAQAIELGGSRLFGADRVQLHLLSDYAAAGTSVTAEHLPTRDNLRRAFETIAKEAKAGDILLVYLAGHGVMTPGVAGEAEYYYLSREAQSSDLSDPAVRKLWGVSSSELTEWIKNIKAAKQVMVLDTCSAGGAIEKLVAKRQIPGAQVIALEQLKDRTGVHILAGAAADKVSYEASQFGQGLLTYALLTGMKGAALKDEIIDVQKLFQYTRDEVPKLARQIGGIQEPRLSSPQGESFAIGRMNETDRQKVPLAQIKPMIQRASFQDEAKMKDVLKLGQRFDDRLKLETYAAARGSMVYVDADDFPEAWQVSGRYRKEADGVRVMARLFRGEEEKGSFEVLLPLDEAEQTDALLAATVKAMGRGL